MGLGADCAQRLDRYARSTVSFAPCSPRASCVFDGTPVLSNSLSRYSPMRVIRWNDVGDHSRESIIERLRGFWYVT